LLDPQALTVGFARRFSTYKRGALIFSDIDRLVRLLNNPKCPVQFIIAGKAHPLDNPGKEIIQKIVEYSADERFRNRIIFLEDYDINVARYMVQGCDVWLNNPRRPQEASGTSGMKAALNGALNVSILDGWWDEGYSEETGFKIGNGEEYDNVEVQDHHDSEALYNVLENEVVPLFMEQDESGIPTGWLKKMKATIHNAGKQFSAQRMLMDYTNNFYVPAIKAARRLAADDFDLDRRVSLWFERLSSSWEMIEIRSVDIPDLGPTVYVGQKFQISMDVFLDSIQPEDVRVEIISGRLNSQEQLLNFSPALATLNGDDPGGDGVYHYNCEITCRDSGRFGVTARVIPKNENLLHTFKPKMISWW
jgi:starch phosphorylase